MTKEEIERIVQRKTITHGGANTLKRREVPGGEPWLLAYPDAGSYAIGYGHNSDSYFKVESDTRITEAEAEELFQHDVREAEKAVNNLVTVPLTQNQFNALVSFVYNIGRPQFAGSTLLQMLNSGDYIGAGNQFQRWKYSNGEVSKALISRRAGELRQFWS